MGYGLVEEAAGTFQAQDYGAVIPPHKADLPERLRILHDGVRRLIDRWQPEEVALEDFVVGHVRAAVALGEARAVVILAAAQAGLPVYLYKPAEVKQLVASYGRGGKEQVQEMVRLLLGMREPPQPQDAADALAVALCHCFRRRARTLLEGWPPATPLSPAGGHARIEKEAEL